jgi:hypothetical protein
MWRSELKARKNHPESSASFPQAETHPSRLTPGSIFCESQSSNIDSTAQRGFSARAFGAQRWQIPFSGGLVVNRGPQFHNLLARGPQAHQ